MQILPTHDFYSDFDDEYDFTPTFIIVVDAAEMHAEDDA